MLQRPVYGQQESAVSSLSFWCVCLRLWRSAQKEGQRGRSCHAGTVEPLDLGAAERQELPPSFPQTLSLFEPGEK